MGKVVRDGGWGRVYEAEMDKKEERKESVGVG